jgi:iron complex outermembrane receptor protein
MKHHSTVSALAAARAAQSPPYAQLMFAALVGAMQPAFAQEAATETEEIVVTGPLEGSRIESLQGADILQRDDIVENLNGGLGDTLDAQPGVSTTFFGAGASRPIIRGLGEDRVLVLENGLGAIDASTASPDHAVTADGLDAERIEILRGSAALAYGGNAIGGVVNVIDQSIPTRAVDGYAFEGLAGYSTVNDGRQGSANFGADAGPLAFRLTAAARETDDYKIPGFANVDGTGAEGTAPNSWTSFRAYTGGASLVRDWGFTGVAVKRIEDEYGLPPEAPSEPGGHIELEQTRYEARGDFRVDLGPFDRIDFGAQQADYAHTEFEGSGEAGTRFESSGWEGRVEAHHHSDRLRGAIGLQYTDVDFAAFGDEAFITPTNTRDIGVFVIERWDTGKWGFEGGARLERRELDNETAGSLEFDNVSASAGAFMRPAEGWFVGATVARTERAPSQIELFANGPHLATANFEIGDPTLGQETAFSAELSARYNKGPLSFELNVFNIEFGDYIALIERGDVWWLDEATETSGFAPDESDPSIPDGAEILPVFIFTQQDARFTGGEISARLELFEAAGVTFAGDVAYDLVRAEFDGGGHPPRIPPNTLTVGFSGESAHWAGRVEVVDTAEQDRLAVFETPTDGFTFLNAGIAFRPYGAENDRLVLRLDGRNLTDEEGRVHASFLKDELPLPGRNVRFVLTTAF